MFYYLSRQDIICSITSDNDLEIIDIKGLEF